MQARESLKTLVGIIRDDLNACPERETCLEFGTIQNAWIDQAPHLQRWFFDTFVDDPETHRRLSRAMLEAERWLVDLARLHYAETGDALHVPERLRASLRGRILRAFFPTVKELAQAATKHPAVIARDNLLKRIEVEEWRTR